MLSVCSVNVKMISSVVVTALNFKFVTICIYFDNIVMSAFRVAEQNVTSI